MPYCPIKQLATKLSGKESSFSKGYLASDECDKEECGFWSKAYDACGMSLGHNSPQAAKIVPKKE